MKNKVIGLLMVGIVIFTGSTATFADQDISAVEAGWATYTSPELHIAFAYPGNWKVDAPASKPSEFRPYVVTLYPPTSDPLNGNKIEMAYLAFEMLEGQNLQAWSEMYELAAVGGPIPEATIIQTRRLIGPDGLERQLLHKAASQFGPSQTVLLSNGRLVLSISTYTHAEAMTQVLKEIVAHVTFAPEAPKTLNSLYGTHLERPSLESIVAENARGGGTTCDVVCQDQQAAQALTPVPPPTPSPEFLEQERKYKELLEQQNPPASSKSSSAVQPLGTAPDNRKSLPSNWWSPIVVTSGTKSVDCSSSFHTDRAAMAIDIQGVYTGTVVYAAQGGTVMFAGWTTYGYGNLMRIATDNVMVAAQNRKYWHNYAHLSAFSKVTGNSVTRGEQVAAVGSTGNSTGPHLHLHITLDLNKNDVNQVAVDLSPMRGFRPNLSYPTTGTCGQVEPRANNPIIVEPVMFTERYQPRTGHYWFCYTDLPRTGECYMYGVPNDGTGWDPLNTSQSPELRFSNVYVETSGTYYLWACGRGGSYNDDSLHMGYNGTAPTSSQRMTAYHEAAWRWKSIRMDLSRPYFWMAGGSDRVINVWMREDGMRIDRILLTRDAGYDPTNNIRCGGY